MRQFFKRLRIKIRTWNHPWIPNPFYSPSLDMYYTGQKYFEGMVEALKKYPMDIPKSIDATEESIRFWEAEMNRTRGKAEPGL